MWMGMFESVCAWYLSIASLFYLNSKPASRYQGGRVCDKYSLEAWF